MALLDIFVSSIYLYFRLYTVSISALIIAFFSIWNVSLYFCSNLNLISFLVRFINGAAIFEKSFINFR